MIATCRFFEVCKGEGFGRSENFVSVRSYKWCREGESNPHALRRRILSPVRLPVPPSRQIGADYSKNYFKC